MIRQYPGQYPYPKQPNYQKPEDNKKWLIVGIIVLLGVVLIYFLFFRSEEPTTMPELCGNDVCDTEENCWDCSVDCKCRSGQYCSEETKKCMTPSCGNGICESFENTENCCNDCPCLLPEETCNPITHKCELPEVAISDERAKELIESYLSNQGKTVNNFREIRSTLYKDQPAKLCTVKVEGEDNFYSFIVTEGEQVIEMPIFN